MTEAALEGTRTLARDPRRSPRAGLSNLLSLNREAFIRRGFGVLKMDLFSRNRALQGRGDHHQLLEGDHRREEEEETLLKV